MTTQIRAFNPAFANQTANAAVTASNAVLQLTPTPPIGVRAIRVANVGTQVIFIELGAAGAVASLTTSMPILANTVEVFTIKNNVTHVAHIAASTGSTLYVTQGEGL